MTTAVFSAPTPWDRAFTEDLVDQALVFIGAHSLQQVQEVYIAVQYHVDRCWGAGGNRGTCTCVPTLVFFSAEELEALGRDPADIPKMMELRTPRVRTAIERKSR